MAFTNPIHILPRPHFTESSPLRSNRDSSNISRQWLKHRSNTDQSAKMVEAIRMLQLQLNMLKNRLGGVDGEQIRVQLCVDGVPTYYLLYGEVDPDQTP